MSKRERVKRSLSANECPTAPEGARECVAPTINSNRHLLAVLVLVGMIYYFILARID